MARLRRRWRILKWAGLVISLLTVITWPMSVQRRWYYYRDVGSYNIGLELIDGYFGVECYNVNQNPEPFGGVESVPSSTDILPWRFEIDNTVLAYGNDGTFTVWDVSVPFWMPFLIVASPTTILWWLDRRRIPPGHCQKCGYNLTGNVSGVCPECGEPIARQTVSADSRADALVGHSRSATES